MTAATLSYGDWFTDPRLVALLDTAVANNRDLMAATARIEQARAQYRIQDSRRLPTAVASAAASRTRTPLGTLDSEAAGAVTTDRFDVGVGVTSFELDFWGRVANLSDAARAQYLATEANQRAFYLSLIADVASTISNCARPRRRSIWRRRRWTAVAKGSGSHNCGSMRA